MKIRTDFVTNSSSSSFILAQKGELSEEQKNALAKAVEENMMGKLVLKADATEEEIEKFFEEYYLEEEEQQQPIREALKSGKNIYWGYVDFEESDWTIRGLYSDIWDSLATDKKDFEIIEGKLMY